MPGLGNDSQGVHLSGLTLVILSAVPTPRGSPGIYCYYIITGHHRRDGNAPELG